MYSKNVEGLMGTPSRNIPGLIHGGWKRMKQTRMMGKQTRKKVNMFKRKGLRRGMQISNPPAVYPKPMKCHMSRTPQKKRVKWRT